MVVRLGYEYHCKDTFHISKSLRNTYSHCCVKPSYHVFILIHFLPVLDSCLTRTQPIMDDNKKSLAARRLVPPAKDPTKPHNPSSFQRTLSTRAIKPQPQPSIRYLRRRLTRAPSNLCFNPLSAERRSLPGKHPSFESMMPGTRGKWWGNASKCVSVALRCCNAALRARA